MAIATKWWIGRALALTLALSACVACNADAQPISQTNPGTEAALHDMTRLAGVIFAGRVIGVRKRAGTVGVAGSVEIEFAVENAIRGVAGDSYTLREWAGLWPAGDEPFRVGQRYLMLLHAPGASGLSSPIGGADGAMMLRPTSLPVAMHPYAKIMGADSPEESGPVDTLPATQSASYATVIAALKRWQKDDDAAR